MDVITIPRAIAGYILILFVPGYAITWALYPTRDELAFIERIALSFVLSIVSVMISVLFADIFLGIDVTPVNIVIVILLVTVLATLAWGAQAAYSGSRLKTWLTAKTGGGPSVPGREGGRKGAAGLSSTIARRFRRGGQPPAKPSGEAPVPKGGAPEEAVPAIFRELPPEKEAGAQAGDEGKTLPDLQEAYRGRGPESVSAITPVEFVPGDTPPVTGAPPSEESGGLPAAAHPEVPAPEGTPGVPVPGASAPSPWREDLPKKEESLLPGAAIITPTELLQKTEVPKAVRQQPAAADEPPAVQEGDAGAAGVPPALPSHGDDDRAAAPPPSELPGGSPAGEGPGVPEPGGEKAPVPKGRSRRPGPARGKPKRKPRHHRISPLAGPNGKISPEITIHVPEHGSQAFTITPDPGFEVADVKVDRKSVGPRTSFLFEDVTVAHSILVIFRKTSPGDTP